MYNKLGWTIKGPEDYSLEKPELSLHKAELTTELAGADAVDDSASGSNLKRKQSAAVPLANPVEDNNNAFYASVSSVVLLIISVGKPKKRRECSVVHMYLRQNRVVDLNPGRCKCRLCSLG